jgi:hypothetical protein
LHITYYIHIFVKDKARDMEKIKIEDVKKGEFIHKLRSGSPAKKVWQKMAYCKFNKAWVCDDMDDISNAAYLKKGTLVVIAQDY